MDTRTMSDDGVPPPARHPSAFESGHLIAGRFRIEERLGKGGMGAVYAATDTALGDRLVALKTILPELDNSGVLLRRFQREVQYAQKVTHRNVCRIFDVGRHEVIVDGGPPRHVTFVTMEHLDGETLSDYLDRVHILSPAQALPIVRQLAAGLDAIHAAGIVHRDFKSPNVMLVPAAGEPRVVITDFGLACVDPSTDDRETDQRETRLTSTGRFIGSPLYIAPEQIDGSRAITPATDVYALGVVLYEMLTAQQPFTGASAMKIAMKRLTTPPTPPSVHLPSIDPVWEAVILRCLARDPAVRFQRAADVVAALENMPLTPVVSPDDPTVPIGAPLETSRALLRGAWVAAAVAAVLGLGAAIYRMQQPDPARAVTMSSVPPPKRPSTDPLQVLTATLARPTWPGAFVLQTSDGRTQYTVGEDIAYRVSTDAPGHLYFFVFGRNGAGSRIFPNDLDSDAAVPAGSSSLPRPGYSFPVQPPYGEELHVAIFSEGPLPVQERTSYSIGEITAILRGTSAARWRAAHLLVETAEGRK